MQILLMGAGSGLRDFLSLLPKDVKVVGLCDNDVLKHGKTVMGYPVYVPSEIGRLAFDFVVITARAGDAMRDQLMTLGVERERILLFYPSYDFSLRRLVNRDMEMLSQHLGLKLHPVSLCTMQVWPENRPEDEAEALNSEDDFCRQMSLRLAAERIKRNNVDGAVAELGVYRGDTAALLNRLFAERPLYLFDTFQGFSENDLVDGEEEKYSQATAGEFEDTTVELVLSRMKHPEKVVVRKGYFPETTEGLEERFALVSLDVDLYKPTLAGLTYFYPRLAPGGHIFVHDYNSIRFNGVRKAVDEFADDVGAPIVQIPDLSGTVILSK